MSDNLQQEFIESARNYSDTRLMNMIKQSFNFSKEKVQAAKVVAIERGLITEAELGQFQGKVGYMRDAKSMLEGGRSVDDIVRNLVSRGATEEEATKAVHEASKVADMNRKPIEEEKSSNWIWIIAVIVVLRIIRSIMNNN